MAGHKINDIYLHNRAPCSFGLHSATSKLLTPWPEPPFKWSSSSSSSSSYSVSCRLERSNCLCNRSVDEWLRFRFWWCGLALRRISGLWFASWCSPECNKLVRLRLSRFTLPHSQWLASSSSAASLMSGTLCSLKLRLLTIFLLLWSNLDSLGCSSNVRSSNKTSVPSGFVCNEIEGKYWWS